MENCRLRVVESDEALKFELAVNACLADLESAGCAYEVAASVDGYFYKAVIKHSAPGVSASGGVDPDSVDYMKRFNRCGHCGYYSREYGRCSLIGKPVKFAGQICDEFASEKRA